MREWLGNAALAAVGLAGGLIVGSGLVALITVLDIIPRLAQVARIYRRESWLEWAVVLGALFWTAADFFDLPLGRFQAGAAVLGWFQGVFIGMLAAALTEVLNVMPILARRLNMQRYMLWLLIAMVAGKIAGSLFDWFVYSRL